MKSFVKWTAVAGAIVTGAGFAYALVLAARQRLEAGLARAEQVADDASRVLARTQDALHETQRTVRDLRTTIS